MIGLGEDLRHALRTLRRRPGFTAVALLTLALGAGVNAAAFGILNRVVLRPLPFPDADRLVSIGTALPDEGGLGLSIGDAVEIGRTSRVFESVGWLERPSLSFPVVLTGTEPERVAGVWVSAGFFRTLGVQPHVGRLFLDGEDRQGAARVAVLGHGAWRTRWGGDPEVVGRSVEVNGVPVTIVGVLPEEFESPLGGESPVLWLAQPYVPFLLESREPWLAETVARLRPGADLADARAELGALAADLRERFPAVHGRSSLVVEPLHAHWVGDLRAPLVFLFAGALLVLLVACVNLGILVAARNAARGGEVAVRRALGAGHGRLVRGILSESVLLGIGGTVLGVILSLYVGSGVRAVVPVDLPRLDGRLVDPRFVAFAAVVAVGAGIAVGLVPVLRALRTAPAAAVRARGAGRDGGLGSVLIGVESAAVVALLIGSALAARGLSDLLAVDPGFEPYGRVVAEVTVPESLTWRAEGGPARQFAFLAEAPRRVAELSGVEAAGFVSNPPLTPAGWSGRLWLHGRANEDAPSIDWEVAGTGYFEAAGIGVLRGRTFTSDDDADAPLVVIVNETLARRYFPAGDAIGSVVTGESEDGPWRTIIGVVADVRQQSLGQTVTRPQMYIHDLQGFAFDTHHLVYRATRGDGLERIGAVRAALNEIAPGVAVGSVRPMSALVRESASAARFNALLLGLFALVATVLGLAGVYGVVSDAVERRRREIALRMALGADRLRVLLRELVRGTAPVAAGAIAGVGLALAGVRIARGAVAGLGGIDLPLVLAVCAALLAAAALAVLLPVRRAAAASPASVLRED